MHVTKIGRAAPVASEGIRLAVKSHSILVENTHPSIAEGQRAKLFEPFNLMLTLVKGLNPSTGELHLGYGFHKDGEEGRAVMVREIGAMIYRCSPAFSGVLDRDYGAIERIKNGIRLAEVSPDFDSLPGAPSGSIEHVDFAVRLDALYAAAGITSKGQSVLSIPKSECIYNVGTHFVRLRFPDEVTLTGGVLMNAAGVSFSSCKRCSSSIKTPTYSFAHRIVLIHHSGGKWYQLPVTPLDIHEYLQHSGSTFERVGEPLPAAEDAASHRRLFEISGLLV